MTTEHNKALTVALNDWEKDWQQTADSAKSVWPVRRMASFTLWVLLGPALTAAGHWAHIPGLLIAGLILVTLTSAASICIMVQSKQATANIQHALHDIRKSQRHTQWLLREEE